ncbi:MAG TPA: hybrid sensor histidine kinase/response regulator [Vitreimonas sp.]|uniref:ATP-binding response regulator n=1 Tax=Vitreimonas sp. TaxID=3069702 RepID=UPI002D48632B|nr:hybrid sensor histidine kinase/response regulator [Vitreimonas sp.]HYD88962.1 hybrid sensor histidine kinase/response regulator [Vitreimonas sp.]
MAEPDRPNTRHTPHAETILAAAIGVVSLIVISMGMLLWSGEMQHRNEGAVVERVRAARTQLIQASQAQHDAEAIAARYAATDDRALLGDFEAAKASARRYLANLRGLVNADAEASAQVTRIENLLERRFDLLDAETSAQGRLLSPERPQASVYADFRAESAALFVLLNGRIDEARAAENATRVQLSVLAVTLAALSLIGSCLALLALRRERTQWRLAHAAAEDARAKAAASDIAKTRFLAVASHDMRQPLHALTLYLTALERRVENTEAREIVGKMDRAVQSMIGMFASLLDLARLQAGVITPEITDTPLQPILDAAAAENPGGKVETPTTDLAIRSDPRLLERVVSNLVGNAVKHGGSARILVRADGDTAEITVADEGPGIAPEDQERIFTEFERLGVRSDGLGLGLTIVRRLAELLDISVTVESTLGEGASFIVRAPLAAPLASAPARAASVNVLRGVPVLAMDDDTLAREAIAGLLTDLGAEVRACADGACAEAIVQQGFAPKLLVLDLRIDGQLRGLEIAERLREMLAPAPPVIMVTGDTEQTTLESLRASGYAWLIKPIDPADLGAAAAALLENEPVSST